MDISKYEQFFIRDEPIPYKSLLIYPVTVYDYLLFHTSINCLSIEKNKIPDPKIISMSYLDFLFYLIYYSDHGDIYNKMLIDILKICLNIKSEDIKYNIIDEKGRINLILKVETVFDNGNEKITGYIEEVIDKKDFDNIRNIILYQNIPDYDDTYIDPKVEAAFKETQEFMNRNKKKICSFEDQLVCVMLALKEFDTNNINKLTLRKFSKILERYDYKFHYGIYKTAEMSGMVTFKEEIDHWMSDLKKNKYADIGKTAMEYEKLENKIKSV